MSSILEVINANELYEKERIKLDKLCSETRLINDSLDLEEVRKNLDYAKTKELYITLLCRINDKDKLNKLKNIMSNKKEEEYPEILKVHYYPIIKEIDFLSEENKIELDKILKECYGSGIQRSLLYSNLDKKVLNFLIENKVLEKEYIFHCNCDDEECYDKVITQDYFDKLKDYWNKEQQGIETTHEEDEQLNYGCFSTDCWNDGNVEISSLDDFNKNLRRVDCKFIQKPDMTLDDI